MNITKNKKFIYTAVLTCLLSIVLCFCSLGAEDNFEESISAFPESYKPYLRELHGKYPEWVFVPFDTGLDWNTVIDNEVGAKSLIDHSASSENLKSKEPGDYDASKDKYIYKDGGFVTANRLAVEYFIDPRNFLNEEGIFQFEQLSFSDSFTVSDVEAVLKGSFMADSYITYYDSEGALTQTKEKYAKVIFEAGKTYNINPCYIASKIRNEVGADGSASVSGTHSVYPGIYNFYNIGASDGAGAITRGLEWANGGSEGTATTYGRPWNTPQKSIMGGAEYLAKSYIAVGQFTGYLQKFNVNPNGDKALYSHQYMTNVSGACSQGYTNYTAYAKTGKLYQKNVFSIPVYKNMPSEDISVQKSANADSMGQTAKLSTTVNSNVRTGPSTNNAKLTDSAGNVIQLKPSQQVRIISKCFTDSDYYISVLQYPHWVEVSFTHGGKTYTGYVPEDFVSYTSHTAVQTGAYELSFLKGEKTAMRVISSDSSVAKVTASGTVEFLKNGTVYLTTYDSVGRYDIVKYTVSSDAPLRSEMTVTPETESIKIEVLSEQSAKKYIYTLCDMQGEIIAQQESDKPSYTFSSLPQATKYSVSAKVVLSDSGEIHSAAAYLPTATKPGKVSGVSISAEESGAKISWKKIDGSTGYVIYGYDNEAKKYTKLYVASASKSSYIIAEDKLIYDSYVVRAYIKNVTQYIYGAVSQRVSLSGSIPVPEGLSAEYIRTDSFTLVWDKVEGADSYSVSVLSDGKWKTLATVKEASYTVKNLIAGSENAYRVAAVKKSVMSGYSETLYVMTLPEKVTSLKVTDVTSSSLKLSWNKVSSAKAYNIYGYENGEYVLLGECTGNSYSFTSLKALTEYKYKIAAVAKGEKLTVTGAYSDEAAAVTLPEKVTSLRVSETGGKKVKLEWDETESASYYTVYKYDSAKKSYVKAAECEIATAVISGLKIATQYKFKVSVTCVVNKVSCTSEMSDEITVKTIYPAPESFSLTNVTAGSYKLSWEKIDEAAGYNIYRQSGSKYEKIASTKNNYYSVSSLKNGDVHYYKVTALYTSGKKTVESALSKQAGAATLPGKVTNLKASASTTYATLTWTKVKNADCYNVYIYEDGKYNLQKTVTGTSYKVTGLRQGATYKFTVRAYIKVNTGTTKGSMASVSATTKPAKVSKINLSAVTDTTQKISWPAATGANYYYIYRYSSSAKKYVKVAETSARSYTFKNLSAGKTYGYYIHSAVVKNKKQLSLGVKSAAFKFSTDPAKVVSLKSTSATSSKVSLSWGKVSGATKYEISYYSAQTGTYVLAGTSTKNTFTVSGLSAKTSYKFKVRAVRTLSGKDYTGSYSSAITVKTK